MELQSEGHFPILKRNISHYSTSSLNANPLPHH